MMMSNGRDVRILGSIATLLALARDCARDDEAPGGRRAQARGQQLALDHRERLVQNHFGAVHRAVLTRQLDPAVGVVDQGECRQLRHYPALQSAGWRWSWSPSWITLRPTRVATASASS